KPYIYRTHDGGKTWTLIAHGIPDGSFVNVVREDPKKRGLLYAGTELGMYVSFDDGDQWQPLQLNLPVTSIRDIDVHGDDVVVATHGRAFWILDNITPLRQLSAKVLESDAWLFEPAETDRVHPAGFTGTPFQKDEPLAENPPQGAMIDYYLKKDTQSAVTLDVLDQKGEVVRHYSSDDKPVVLSIGKIFVTPDWLAQPMMISKSVGVHRIAWDLHYAQPAPLQEAMEDEMLTGGEPNGVWALPGRYTIKLTVDGHPYTQPLLVTNDPRVKVSQADLVAQFDLARRIEAERVRVVLAYKEAKNLLTQAKAAQSKASQPLA